MKIQLRISMLLLSLLSIKVEGFERLVTKVKDYIEQTTVRPMLRGMEAALALAEEELNQKLFNAIQNQQVAEMSQLIRQGADVNTVFRDQNGQTPLHMVANHPLYYYHFQETEDKDQALVKTLLQHGADINKVDWSGKTPLIAALGSYDSNIAEQLLNAGADVTINDKENVGPLHYAIMAKFMYNYDTIVNILLNKGVDVHLCDNKGSTLLHYAGANGRTETVKMLLDKGINPNSVDVKGWTPLRNTCLFDNTQAAKLLLDSGANPDIADKKGITPLMDAVFRNNIEVVTLLLDSGANPDIVDKYGNTPLHLAVEENNDWMAESLVKYGASIYISNNENVTPLQIAHNMDNEALEEKLKEWSSIRKG